MKLITIVNARMSLQKLVQQDLPIRTAWQVMKLTDECNIHLQFYGNQIRRLGDEPDPEKLAALQDMEISELDARVRIPVPLDGSIRMSAVDLKHLEPFIDFEEEV